MLDLALIGIEFQTTGLEKGTAALKNTEQAANRTADAADRATVGFNAMGGASDKTRNAASQLTQKINEQITRLQEQASLFGMGARQAALYKMALDGATDSQVKQANAALKSIEALQAGRQLGEDIGRAVKASAAVIVVGVTAAAVAFEKLIGNIAKYQDMAEQNGGDPAGLASLRTAADVGGASVESMVQAANRMQLSLSKVSDESKGAGAALAKIGINVEEFKKLRADEQLREVAKALNEYGDGGGKVAVIQTLMGRGATALLPAFKELGNEVEVNNRLTTEQIQLADEYKDAQARARSQLMQTVEVMAVSALPVVTEFIGALRETITEITGVGAAGSALAGNNAIPEFAASAAIALATLADGAFAVGQMFNYVGNNIGAAGAQLEMIGRGEFAAAGAIGRASIEFNDKLSFSLGLADKLEARLNAIRSKTSFGGMKDINSSWENDKPQIDFNPTEKADRKGASAANAAASQYAQLILRIKERIQLSTEELANGRQLSDAEKQEIKLTELLGSAKNKMNAAQRAAIENTVAEVRVKELLVLNQRATLQAAKELADAESKRVRALEQNLAGMADQNKSLRDEIELIGLDALGLLAVTQARQGAVIAQKEEQLARLQNTEFMGREQIALAEEIRLLKEKRDLTGQKDVNTFNDKTTDEAKKSLDAFFDPTKAQSFGDALKGAFGGAGDSMGRFMSLLDEYAIKQATVDKARADAGKAYGDDSEKLAAVQKAITQKELSGRLSSYSSMAGAAKGFFKEGTKGYKTLEVVQAAFAAAQAVQNLAIGTSAAATGIATQAQGDPYTAFARMAAMAAAMANLGFAVSGFNGSGGSGETAASVQARQGTGTVLGDSEAKSNSLSNAMHALQDNTFAQLKYSSGMLGSLRSIERAMTGLANIIFRTNGLTAGNASGIAEGTKKVSNGNPLLDAIGAPTLESLFSGKGPWSKISTTIKDSGIAINGTLAELMQGQGMRQFTDIETTKSAFFGLSKKTSTSTQYSALNEQAAQQIGMVFRGISDSIKDAGKSFGLNADELTAKLASTVIDLGKVSLRGLKGKDLQDALQAVFSGAADTLAMTVIPGLEELQKVGEGYYETLIRASASLQTVNGWLAMFKMTLVETSIAGAVTATKLADLFGGINELNAANQAYYERFFTDAERAAQATDDMRVALATVGMQLPATKDEFRAMVSALDLTTDSGREAYHVLLSLAPTFADSLEALKKLSTEAAKKLIDTFTAKGTLVPTLNATALQALRLRDSLTRVTTAAGAISTLFLDVSSGLITFGDTTIQLTDGMTGAQLAADQLNTEMDDMRRNAGIARIDIVGLSAALAAVDVETFNSAVTQVFESLASRIKATLNAIGNERLAVREAAIRIINPGVMSLDAIGQAVGRISLTAPDNVRLAGAQGSLSTADARVVAAQAAVAAGKAATPGTTAVDAAKKALEAASAQAHAAQAQVDMYRTIEGGKFNEWVQAGIDGMLTPGRAGGPADSGENNAIRVGNALSPALATAAAAQAEYDRALVAHQVAIQANAPGLASAQAELLAAQAAQTAAAKEARAAQLAYISSLQDFSIDSGKAVGKLTRLREETMRYYDAQKQLAEQMGNSAKALRASVAGFKFSQLTDQQKFDKLQSDFATNYAMGLSTQGAELIGYGDKLNAGLNPLLEAAQNVLSPDAYASFVATMLARAETIADRLDALAPKDYAAESLVLLGAIDTALAAIEASSKSADKIIADAISAGSEKTAAGLRAVIAALTGQSIPGFAAGGDFGGGLRIVGENGPELEATGASRIFNASQTKGMFSGAGNAELIGEVRALRSEVASLNAAAYATASNTNKLTRQGDRVERDGVISIVESDFTAAYAAA